MRGVTPFRWSYPGSLGEDEAFQVLIWKQGQSDDGAAQFWPETEQSIDLDQVPQIQNGGAGQYLWSVVLVRISTDERLSAKASPWQLTYAGYGAGDEEEPVQPPVTIPDPEPPEIPPPKPIPPPS